MNPEIKDIAEIPIAYMSHKGDYNEMATVWQRFMPLIASNNLITPETKFLGVYYDDPGETPAEQLRSEVCITVPASFKPFDNIQYRTIPAGKYAVFLYKGPYEDSPEFYGKIYHEWIPNSGHTPSETPCFERYLNSPEDTAPEELLTEIYVSLED
ncbi:DNA gyrase inhibitor [Poriferisphaera corsica]|uniref:DNA gyrase inhibitor n=1 Tax=Poriferisphaera corsica TaxID=2528020 RepID=A0A517YXS8_9BACT|nr:GyrI-like domain-containing protein [Poriferisphaera corsica]QDU35032.1 DNA gyrase inhibitor [Poriferisphaera corsica]